MTRTTRLEFPGAAGQTISGRLEMPDAPPRSGAIFAHCFTCSKDLKAVVRISRALAERGIAVLRFDFTGLGESDGDFADTDFSSNLRDLEAAAKALGEQGLAPQLMIGHSLGGAAVLSVASHLSGVEAVVTLGAPSETSHLSAQLRSQEPELASVESAEVQLGGRPVRVGRRLVEELEKTDIGSNISKLGLPLLILHSPVDETVSIDHAAKIYKAAHHPKSFISLDGADHLLLARDEDSRFAAEVIAAWASRYMSSREVPIETDSLGHGQVKVRSLSSRGFVQEVSTASHRWLADEPVSVGGEDRGPSPYDLLLAALGTCKSMTLRMYADRKAWPLTGVEVRLRHNKEHAKDCEACESESGLIDRVAVELSLEGDLNQEQLERLAEIADRCPVHRTMTSETVFTTTLLP